MISSKRSANILTVFLSGLHFREKFFLMVAMPLAGLFIFASITLYGRISLYNDMRHVRNHAESAVAVSALIHELQKERGLTAGFIGSQGKSFAQELAAQRKSADQKMEELLEVFRKHYSAGMIAAAKANKIPVQQTIESHQKAADRTNRNQAEIAARIVSEFAGTAEIRSQADSLSLPAQTAIQYYTNRISSLIRYIDSLATSSSRNEITLLLISYVNLIKSKENAGQERAVLNNTFSRDSFGPGLYERFLSLVAAQNAYNDAFLAVSPINIINIYNEKSSGPAFREAENYRRLAAEKGAEGKFGVDPADWFRIQTEKINLLYDVEMSVATSLKSESEKLLSSAFSQFIVFLLLAVSSAAISLAILFAASGNIRTRTEALLEKMQSISEGDLTIRLSANGKDEITQLETRFNELVEALHSLISRINHTAVILSRSSSQLLKTSSSMASEMEESSIQASNISAMVEEMNQTLIQVSSSVEEMSITIGEVARRASDAANVSREGKNAADDMESLIINLGESTRKIGTVMDNIGVIADQTNLLALNAAIEAAGAGEAGRGFAVVASEVKELAVQSGQFSRDAKDQIGGVLKNVDKSVKAVGNIVKTIKNGLEAVVTIAAAVEEQSVAVKEIATSVAQISLASRETASNVAGIASAARNGAKSADITANLAKELEQVSAEIRTQVSRFRIE